MKRPAFQFYPGDWLRDAALRVCSLEARGLWIDMLALMHQSNPYGHLVINGKAVDDAMLARMVGEPLGKVRRCKQELEAAGVYSVTAEGVMFSRRMVKDEHVRTVRAESGRLGGNPNLLGAKDKQTDNQTPKQIPTPSSSSSSSSSSSKRKKAATPPPPGLEVTTEMRDWAMKNGIRVDLLPETEAFLDWHRSKGSTHIDWVAAWRTWMRKAMKFNAPSKEAPTLAAGEID